MPELPEVETVVRGLRRHIMGATLGRVRYTSERIDRTNPRGWTRALRGLTVAGVERRGKYIIIVLSADQHLVIHLRMTGRIWVKPRSYRRSVHDRFVIELSDDRVMTLVDARQFGRVEWIPPGMLLHHEALARLGPDALSITLTHFRNIVRRANRPIKALLLDQTRMTGLGNIYADESLHLAGIRPTAVAARLGKTRVDRLHRVILDVLQRAIDACGTTFDTFSDLGGEAGGFGPQLRVYQRDGSACQTCGATIRRIVCAGRGTHFCPRCQR